ncbi:hypothetical protein [Calidithermus roseus]|nr:hypothetical protein [Calidithermus roseus]
MTMGILKVEADKAFRRRGAWLLLAFAAALVGLVEYLMLREQAPARHYALTLLLSREAARSLGIFAAAILGAWTAQEYSWRTLALLFSRGTPRGAWLLARWLAMLGSLALVVAMPFGVSLTVLSFYAGGWPAQLQTDGARIAATVLQTAVAELPYLGLALLLAVAGRSVAAVLGGVLGYALVLEAVILWFWPEVGRYLPAALSEAWLGGGAGLGAELAGIVGYALAFVALSWAVLRRQDLGG